MTFGVWFVLLVGVFHSKSFPIPYNNIHIDWQALFPVRGSRFIPSDIYFPSSFPPGIMPQQEEQEELLSHYDLLRVHPTGAKL